jgi:acyl-CoA dehydrogenase
MPDLTHEQRALAAAVADLMVKRSPEAEVRRLMAGGPGYDAAVWAEMAAMGLLGLTIPEQYQGSGAGYIELGLAAEQFGHALLCAPFLSAAVLTPALLLASGDEAECHEILPKIVAGELLATVAYAEGRSVKLPEVPTTQAISYRNDWLVSGSKTFVLDASTADRFYVHATTSEGTAIFAVDATDPRVSVATLPTVDQTRRLGTLELSSTPARLIGTPGGCSALTHALECAAVALISQQAGAAMTAMRMAAEYARTRYQFGRAIGSFQAVKHLCADMLLEAESTLSAARHVAAALDSESAEFRADLALAQAYCSDAFVFVAATNIQVHGGIGFTWEHPAHLYLRRARGDAQLLGSPRWHRERYIRLRSDDGRRALR